MKAVLSENHVRYVFVDITGSMTALKSFLVLRDTSDAYQDIRGTRTVGVPLLLVDDIPYIIDDAEQVRELIRTLHLAE